jgi:hypothetical protein
MIEQATLPPPTKVTGPGVYDIPEADYHADPVPGGSLSSTGARKLLPPSCPALYKHWRDNPEPPNQTFELGSAAHKLVLGVGPKLELVDRDRWDTNEIKAKVAAIRERGDIPLKREPYEAVHAMAEALRAHPFASKLFAPGAGQPEQTLVWTERGVWYEQVGNDNEDAYEQRSAGVACRALLDWLPNPRGGRLILPDYKTCASAAPEDAVKAIARYGYHIQLAFYLAGLRALGLADERAEGVLVMQEKTPPYLVTVVQPDATAMRLAGIRVRQALDSYAECTTTGQWPGYSDDVVLAELPPWETKELKGDIW